MCSRCRRSVSWPPGTADQRIGLHHHHHYAALARQAQANATTWVVEGAGHIESAFVAPAEYERRLVAFFEQALAREPSG